MKRKSKIFITLLLILSLSLLMCSCGESSSERDMRSGFNKWSSGDFDSMTDSERRLVNDFLEWSNDN